MPIQESAYRKWLSANSGLSSKGQNELVSRLKRRDRMVPISDDGTIEQYERSLRSHKDWQNVPSASQTSIVAAARKYLEWAKNSR